MTREEYRPSLQCRRILAGRVDIYFHRIFRPPSWNRKTVESWGEVKSLPSVGGRKKNWGRGRGGGAYPSPPPTASDILSFSPQFSQSAAIPKWRQNTRKIERWKPPKPPALQASIDHVVILGIRMIQGRKTDYEGKKKNDNRSSKIYGRHIPQPLTAAFSYCVLQQE